MMRVLVVDDTALDRRLLEGLLRKHGIEPVETASDGASALERLEAAAGDFQAVVTDLNMPEIDGLELTNQIRLRYPWVPVILITAHGNEELALRALEEGAASYVPKSQLATRLADTVEHAARAALISRQGQQFAQSMTRADLEFELQNDESLFSHLGEMVQKMMGALGTCDARDEVRVVMALEETLRRALYRGNLEFSESELRELQGGQPSAFKLVVERRALAPYRDRRLGIRIQLAPDQARFTIRSAASAFDRALLDGGHWGPDGLGDEHRSYVLMRSVMDEIEISSDGRVVTMIKRQTGAAPK
jgi:CheY-like chemotaxis protein